MENSVIFGRFLKKIIKLYNITTSSAIPHFKDKSLQFLFFNFTPSKNWLSPISLEQNEIQSVCQKIPFLRFFFLREELFQFEKYQRAFLGPSSPDSVPIFEKKFGETVY